MMHAVLITGSRRLTDPEPVFRFLDIERPVVVIHGACRDPRTGDMIGADLFAHEWAVDNGLTPIEMPAPWDRWRELGLRDRNAAGMFRNKEMAHVLRSMTRCGYTGKALGYLDPDELYPDGTRAGGER